MSLWRVITVVVSIASSIPAQPTANASIQISGTGLSARERLNWVTLKTLGPKNLGAGLFVAGFQTWRDNPEQDDTHWNGFAKRYGARLAAGGTSNALEAVFGSFWGEDPRYDRAAGFCHSQQNGRSSACLCLLHRGPRRHSDF